MMTSDDNVGGWVKKGQNHDDVILECPLTNEQKDKTLVNKHLITVIICTITTHGPLYPTFSIFSTHSFKKNVLNCIHFCTTFNEHN